MQVSPKVSPFLTLGALSWRLTGGEDTQSLFGRLCCCGGLSGTPGATWDSFSPSLLPSEESVIRKLVEGLQEVDSDLGRQVSTALTPQVGTGVPL